MSDAMQAKGAVAMQHTAMPTVAPKGRAPASDAAYHYTPTTVRPEDEAAYQADLDNWRAMCIRWGNASDVTWRDEQSFKRAWTVQQDRIAALLAAQPSPETAWREGYYTGKRDYAGTITSGMSISTPNPYGPEGERR